MELFNEFIRADITEDQILPVLRDLLPVLLNILGAADVSLRPLYNNILVLILESSSNIHPSRVLAQSQCSVSA